MNSLTTLLEYLLNEELDEVAKTIGEAETAGYALYVGKERVFLYEPEFVKKVIQDTLGSGAARTGYKQLIEYFQIWLPTLKDLKPVADNIGVDENVITRVIAFAEFSINRPNSYNINLIKSRYPDFITAHKGLRIYYSDILKKDLTGSERSRWAIDWENSWKKLDSLRDYFFPENINANDLIVKAIAIGGMGMIQHIPSSDCNPAETEVVISSAAEKGWGPLIYDITMSIISPKWLIADRGSLSRAAHNVWDFYLTKRSDVEKQIIPELITGECDLPKFSDSNKFEKQWKKYSDLLQKYRGQDYNVVLQSVEKLFANVPVVWRYRLKNPLSYQSLINNHKNFIDNERVITQNGEYQFNEQLFNKAAYLYFNTHSS
jgi:hypothetical protein